MSGKKILTSGYVSMDHIIKIKTPTEIGFTSIVANKNNSKIYYGGCSVNIAYPLSKFGENAIPVLRVGSDYEEIGFKNFLENVEVSLEATKVIEDETTSTCYMIQDNMGQHIALFYPGAMDEKYSEPLEDSLFEDAEMGIITVASKKDNEEFYSKCKKHNIPVVFGMKSDFEAFPEPFLKELLYNSKIIFTNECERETLEKMFNLEDITDIFKIGEAEIIITTYGKEGSTYYKKMPDGTVESCCIPICDCTKVVDTTGGGDAYIAGFVYGYVNNMSMSDCCRLGSTLSSFVLEEEGCCTNIPDKEEFIRRFENFKKCKV